IDRHEWSERWQPIECVSWELAVWGWAGRHQSKTYLEPVRVWLPATAEIAQGPGRDSEHAKLGALANQIQERLEGAGTKNKVTTLGVVPGNVGKRPDRLFPDIRV